MATEWNVIGTTFLFSVSVLFRKSTGLKYDQVILDRYNKYTKVVIFLPIDACVVTVAFSDHSVLQYELPWNVLSYKVSLFVSKQFQ